MNHLFQAVWWCSLCEPRFKTIFLVFAYATKKSTEVGWMFSQTVVFICLLCVMAFKFVADKIVKQFHTQY